MLVDLIPQRWAGEYLCQYWHQRHGQISIKVLYAIRQSQGELLLVNLRNIVLRRKLD